jgi:adenylate cyclase
MRTRQGRRIHAALFLGIGLVTTALALAAYYGNVFNRYELDSVDARFSIRGAEGPPDDIVIVEIDDATFSALGVQWPFPRSLHAQLIDALVAAGAKVIAYDVQFTEATSEEEDGALLDSVYAATETVPVVLATTEVDANGKTNVFGGDDVVQEVEAHVGNTVFPTDSGGVIRRFPYETNKLKSFSVVAAEQALGHEVSSSDFPDEGEAWIDYVGPQNTVTSVSFSDVINGQFDPDVFKGKIVVVGPAASSLQDLHPTSTTSKGQLMPGAEVQANAISTVLRDFPLASDASWIDVLLIVILGMLPPLLALRFSLLALLPILLLLGALFAVSAQFAFNHGTIVAFTYPLGALIVSSVGTLGAYYVLAVFERQRTRDTFARFVPEGVVDQVLERTGDELRLGGVEVEGTVMFTDLRGFTTFSEQRSAVEVIEILNTYLSEMSAAILDHGGTLVSYLGDGILAVFGAPIEQPDHAERALAASREMLTQRLPRFNEWLREQGLDVQLRMGIGLNTGQFMSGNVGSERRLEYTAIGDVVNTASRLEGMTKGTPYMMFLADSTRQHLGDDASDLVYVDELDVRGREESVKVWALAINGDGSSETASTISRPEAAPEA